MNNRKPDITTVTAQHLCNTCGACFAACGSGAIRYEESVGGYLFPVVDAAACNRCGVCYQVCPGAGLGKTLTERVASDPFVGEIHSCLVGRATNEEIYRNSQSGGLATALLAHLFADGRIEAAIVAVMEESSPPRGGVRVIYRAEDLRLAQKSKYSPIPLLSALRQLPPEVKRVGLVGVACQLHGLHNLQDLIPVYRKLEFYKIGLVCDRTMTAAAIDYMGRLAAKEPLANVVWRDKQQPAYPGNPVVQTRNGRTIVLKAAQRMMIKDFFTPVRCRLCFDKLNVFADVVCGDPHGIKGIDRVGGESLVLVRTEVGRKLVDSAKAAGAVVLRATSQDAAVTGQGVSKKRSEWAGFMKSWQAMDHPPPRYPFASDNKASKSLRYHKLLLQGMALDDFATREELLIAADTWFLRQKIIKTVLCPLAKVKGFWRRLINGGNR